MLNCTCVQCEACNISKGLRKTIKEFSNISKYCMCFLIWKHPLMTILMSKNDGKKSTFPPRCILSAYDARCFHKVIPVCLCAFISSPSQPLRTTGVVYIAGLILSTCRDWENNEQWTKLSACLFMLPKMV